MQQRKQAYSFLLICVLSVNACLCQKEKEMFLMVYAFLLAFTSIALYADERAI